MKKITIAVLVMISIVSCQKDTLVNELKTNEIELGVKTVEKVNITFDVDPNNEPVLCFKTESDITQYLSYLYQNSDTEDENLFAESTNFKSQSDFMWEVVSEINNAQSLEEIRSIQDKYGDLLLFNDNPDDMDVAPYIPSSHTGYSILCNKYGNIMVGGKIINYNNITSYSDLMNTSDGSKILTKSPYQVPTSLIKSAQSENGNYKFLMSYRKSQDLIPRIYIELIGYRKLLPGVWNKYEANLTLSLNQNTNNWYHSGQVINNLNIAPHEVTGTIYSTSPHYLLAGLDWRYNYGYLSLTTYSHDVGANYPITLDLHMRSLEIYPEYGIQINDYY